MGKNFPRIVFMGTPEFAVTSLQKLINKDYNVVGVITAPDRPAGRGQKIHESEVKKYAKSKNLKILQPEKLKAKEFLDDLNALKPDLQIVVAFRMLPESVWKLPPLGTFNLHASLLPQYRGAAPINHAILNGETITGVTTFFIREDIDTGNILLQKETNIGPDESAGDIHDRLMHIGADVVIHTVEGILDKSINPINQNELMQPDQPLKLAPKIFREDCKINWNANSEMIHNKIRGLSPFPGAFTEITNSSNAPTTMKLLGSSVEKNDVISHTPGKIFSDNKSYLKVSSKDGFIHLNEIQLAGKKRMKTDEFLRGFKNIDQYHCI